MLAIFKNRKIYKGDTFPTYKGTKIFIKKNNNNISQKTKKYEKFNVFSSSPLK